MADKDSGYIKSRVENIAQKTLDINQFLVSKVGLEPVKYTDPVDPVTVTYHDPCHLKKTLGVLSKPIRDTGLKKCLNRTGVAALGEILIFSTMNFRQISGN